LSGSYARETAVGDIKDVDVLLLLHEDQLDRTPNAVLLAVKRILDGYPDATTEATGQRRSVHLEFPVHNLHLDIVPAVAVDGLNQPLKVPDRPRQEWIPSDPLGYAARLTKLNQEHGGKVIPLIKLVKAWRDVQMTSRRPKSYVLEVMVFDAVEQCEMILAGSSTAQNFADFTAHTAAKYHDLMENGTDAPRIGDPQTGARITAGWDRSHFETFMRRAREAARAAERALNAPTTEDAATEWQCVFGSFWPNAEMVKAAARAEAPTVNPGATAIASQGFVVGTMAREIATQPTRYHGE
jgi:hypothetical protein